MRLKTSEKGNAVVIVLVALVVVAVGALAYMSMQKDKGGQMETAQAEPAAGEAAQQAAANNDEDKPALEIKDPEGDPVVGKLSGQDIKRSQVLGYIQTLSPNLRQLPLDQLFPLALNQMINSEITAAKARTADLDNDPAVKAQLQAAKANIVRQVFLQKQIEQGMTDEKLKAAYEEYKSNYPEIQEYHARHILVKDKDDAKDLIKQLNDGASFEELAKEHSIDSTNEAGGELGYLSKQSPVLPEFTEGLFDLEVGEYSKKPIETPAGFHIIEVLDERMQPAPPFERVRGYLAGQMTNEVLNEILDKWRDQADVVVYDINGEPLEKVEPASGASEEAAPQAEEAATPAPEAAKEEAAPAADAESTEAPVAAE